MLENLIRGNCSYSSDQVKLEEDTYRSPEWLSFIEELEEPHRPSPDMASETGPQPTEQQDLKHSDDYCQIISDGQIYRLTPLAADIVRALHTALLDQNRGMSTRELKKATHCGRIGDAFRRLDGKAFYERFIAKDGKNIYKLNFQTTARRGV